MNKDKPFMRSAHSLHDWHAPPHLPHNYVQNISICNYSVQWNLFIKDTLGPAERKVYFGALESVLCREVTSMVSFIQSVL